MNNLLRTNDYFLEDLLSPFILEEESNSLMRTDIKESDKEYVLNIEMPGVNKKDIKLSFDKGYLTISYDVNKEVKNEENHKLIRKERYYSKGSRSFYMGNNIDSSSINASLDNGVLNIVLQKVKEVKKNNYIEIK